MESSRIFIRGLPPNLSTEDFRRHFSKQCAITDAKFFPHRRIGYVGYKNPEEAAKAVKYHHKSFIRMSRIGVELARSVGDQHTLRPRHRIVTESGKVSARVLEDGAVQKHSLGKRKRGDVTEADSDPKLQEFLEVMQPPSKSRTWANEDAAGTQNPSELVAQEQMQKVEAGHSDEEYETVSKKRKASQKSGEPVRLAEDANSDAKAMEDDGGNSKEAEDGNGHESIAGEASDSLNIVVPAASDEDWLRSRTSRLLGLVDGDDAVQSKPPAKALVEPSEDPASLRELQAANMPDEGVQIDEENNSTPALEVERTFADEENIDPSTGRLFVRNLMYTTTAHDLQEHFEAQNYGSIEEVHLPLDRRSGNSKGFAYIQYAEPQAADKALRSLDGKPFQGRLLHIIPAKAKKQTGLDESAISKLPLKKQQQIKRRAEAASSTFNWNSLYMNADAVMSSISDRLGISKSELLDPTSSDAAIKQAHAETHIIQETKSYFTTSGVNLDAFKKRERGDTTILVKNFSYGTKPDELKALFEAHGNVRRILMPPSGTIAIIEFEHADHARSAFGGLAYRKFKDSILFLEKAPRDLFSSGATEDDRIAVGVNKTKSTKPLTTELFKENSTLQPVDTSTLFVRNLNFTTTTERLREVFRPLDGFMSARVKTKPDPKKAGQVLSMGFGFLEFRTKSQAHAALAAMDGYKLEGHELLIKASHKATDAAEERRKEDHAKKVAGRRTKIIIKNLPFEASKKDVRLLFGSYGQLRSVRVPKKFDSSTRGFAFADFVTAREAENAMDALKDTHLLGRRLALDFAAEETVDPEEEIEKMQKKVNSQADKVALQRLTGSGRKKFNVQGSEGVNNER